MQPHFFTALLRLWLELKCKFYHLPNNVSTRSTSSNFPVFTARSPIYR